MGYFFVWTLLGMAVFPLGIALAAAAMQLPTLARAVPPCAAGYGQRYLSIGFTFDHGTVSLGPGETATMSQPAQNWFEQPFGEVDIDQFALDLRTPAPPPVRNWLEAPIGTRGLPDRGPTRTWTAAP